MRVFRSTLIARVVSHQAVPHQHAALHLFFSATYLLSRRCFCCSPLARVTLTRWPLIGGHNFSLEAYFSKEWPVWRLQPVLFFCWSTRICHSRSLSWVVVIYLFIYVAWERMGILMREEETFEKAKICIDGLKSCWICHSHRQVEHVKSNDFLSLHNKWPIPSRDMACFIYSKIEWNVIEIERAIQTKHFKYLVIMGMLLIFLSVAQRNIQISSLTLKNQTWYNGKRSCVAVE